MFCVSVCVFVLSMSCGNEHSNVCRTNVTDLGTIANTNDWLHLILESVKELNTVYCTHLLRLRGYVTLQDSMYQSGFAPESCNVTWSIHTARAKSDLTF